MTINPEPIGGLGFRVRQDCINKVKAANKTAMMKMGKKNQETFAHAIEIAPSTLSSFLNGKNVALGTFLQICQNLDLNWEDIADRPNNPITPPVRQSSITSISILSPDMSIKYPEGPVALDSNFYLERPPKEQDCYREISKHGALIRIKAPEQRGKTSLLIRILHQAQTNGDRTVYISLKEADNQCFTNLDKFLRWFCATVSRKLKLENRLDEYWEDDISCNMRCETYFEEYILPEIGQPLTLGLDEVDRLFAYPDIYGDFFGLLRYLHEEARRENIWQKFRLVLAHSTEIYVPLDINRSPFNAGFPVDLPEFNSQQITELAQKHQLNWGEKEVTQIMSMIGGHPFLVRLSLYHIARQDVSLDNFLQTAATDSGIYSKHLHRIMSALEKQPELLAAMREVAKLDRPLQLSSEIKFKLQAMGLVKITNDGVIPSCELYRQYFQNF
ncbi:AAA-like domain-containing protein [Nostoc sp. FACHB-87]|uniref:AAA-like domain-containing protein n=1 Tax=Nostocaceae TaxID=1162 RepID=UPI0016892BA7|nr:MULTISPECIES: AAA-like domain-containing protein [Nostocaceae]MBD2458720.1 AAA-like domain-containing protein [Nostoc sp. FACHB-87]MBD2479759.1 AAA-like domain-containing protein [Anabaena sp. FACHB-83]